MLYTIILIFILLALFRKKETFVNYKRVTVTPKKTIYDGIVLNLNKNNNLHSDISNKIREVYPIKYIFKDNIDTILKNLNKKSNYISFIPEIIKLAEPNKFKNIRFITSIGVEKPTLISPFQNNINSWVNVNGKTIATLKYSTSSVLLKYIKRSFKLNFKIKEIDIFSKNIINNFKKKEFDAFFSLIAHPNRIIKSIQKVYPLKFVGIEGLDKENVKVIFPNYNKSKIDLTHYDIFNSMPDTLAIKTDVLVNKNFSEENGYNLIQTVFKNLMAIKSIGSDDYKLQMRDFNPEYIYLSNNSHKLHSGVYNFYKSIGLITNNPERSCRYKVGIGECNIKKINHFRLL